MKFNIFARKKKDPDMFDMLVDAVLDRSTGGDLTSIIAEQEKMEKRLKSFEAREKEAAWLRNGCPTAGPVTCMKPLTLSPRNGFTTAIMS